MVNIYIKKNINENKKMCIIKNISENKKICI